VWWREHVRGRGAAIVGTSGDLPSAASEKGRKKVPKPRGNSEAGHYATDLLPCALCMRPPLADT
jgi:hypothetical protein